MPKQPLTDRGERRRAQSRAERLGLLLAVLGGVALRLPLIDACGIMPADGLRLAVWSITVQDKALPLYPLLLQAMRPLCGNAQLAGGLVAALLGAWAVVPLYLLLSERVSRVAGWIGVLIASSSLHCIALSAGVVPNPALIVPLLYAWLFWGRLDPDDRANLIKFNLACGLAALARPEGWALIAPCAWANYRYIRQRGFSRWLGPGLAAALPYLALVGWMALLGHSGYAGEFFGYSLSRLSVGGVLHGLTGYLAALVGHGFAWWCLVALCGCVAALCGKGFARSLAFEALAIVAVLLAALSIQWAPDLHRLLTPAVFAVYVSAAAALGALLRGLRARRTLQSAVAVTIGLLVLLSAALSYGILSDARQDLRGVFDDRLRSWQVAAAATQGRLHSDLPLEASYYSGREFDRYSIETALPGDTLALHSTEGCLEQRIDELRERFELRVLRRLTAPRAFKYGPANVSCFNGSDPGELHVSIVIALDQVR
ncbi:MAG: glycosyltransferase family 39 protein [Candidatus Alcyoniella australis]|nr:glycosyltransferase family 39 protein [Candidatus Alcyoniella australis]